MAKLYGPIQLSGRVGNLVFRKQKNGDIVVAPYSPISKNRLKKGKEFERTREVNNDFSLASRASCSIRTGMGNLYAQFHTGTSANRLNSKLRKVIHQGDGVRGQQRLSLLPNKSILTGFNFVEKNPFHSVFPSSHQFQYDITRSRIVWEINPFNPSSMISGPLNTTHFRFVFAIQAVPDWYWDESSKTHVQAYPGLCQPNCIVRSEFLEIESKISAPIELCADLACSVLPAEVPVVLFTGVEFFSMTNGHPDLYYGGNTLQIASII